MAVDGGGRGVQVEVAELGISQDMEFCCVCAESRK